MSVGRQLNLRFAAVMVGFVGVVLLTYREDILGPILAPLTTWTAQATLVLLHWAGMEAARAGTLIAHPDGFVYEIYYRCTGFLPVAFLTTSILAYPGPLRRKFVGLAVGVPLLIALNLARLVHLFYIGVHHRAAFDQAHAIVWEGILILTIIGLWLGWIRWSDARATRSRRPNHWGERRPQRPLGGADPTPSHGSERRSALLTR
ncbi:MAG: exosortase H [Candidatus Methylomirabilales bacterium]